MKDFPRTTLLYLYMFEYQTMFLPFVHVVCPVSEDAPKYDFTDIVSWTLLYNNIYVAFVKICILDIDICQA